MDPTLTKGNYATDIAHFGINDTNNDDSLTKVENLALNLKQIVIKLKKYGLKTSFYLA